MAKTWITLAFCASLTAAVAAEPSLAEVMQKLEALQQQVQAQQAVIEQLRSQVNQQAQAATNQQVSELVKQEVSTATEKQAESAGDSPLIKLGSNIDNLTLKGDLRLRYEYRDRDAQDKANRDRMRTRFRIGGVWDNSTEGWEIGVGLATGGSDATSTNDTWSDTSFFDTGDIRLDYAYAKHDFALGTADLEVIAGQQKNPFLSSWVLWDSDVRPAGITLKAEACGFFGTIGWYDVYNAGNEICSMAGAQAGYGFKTEAINGKVAAAYYSYEDSVWKDSDMNGDGFVDYGDSGFGFQIGDLYAEVGMPLGEKASVGLFADYFKNFGATGGAGQGYQMDPSLDASSEDSGWIAGIGLRAGAFSLDYAYAVIAENAVIPYLMDADFGSGLNFTDVEGHRIKAGYKVTKNCSISLMAQFAEALEREGVGGVDLYQLDMSYKF